MRITRVYNGGGEDYPQRRKKEDMPHNGKKARPIFLLRRRKKRFLRGGNLKEGRTRAVLGGEWGASVERLLTGEGAGHPMLNSGLSLEEGKGCFALAEERETVDGRST